MTNKIELQTKEPAHEEIINYINDQNIYNSDKDKLTKKFTRKYLKTFYSNEIESSKDYFINNFLEAKSHHFHGLYWEKRHQDLIKHWTGEIKSKAKFNNKHPDGSYKDRLDFYVRALIEAIEKEAWEEQARYYLDDLKISNPHFEGNTFVFECPYNDYAGTWWLKIQLDKFFNQYDTTHLIKSDIDDRVGRMEQATF